MHERRHLKAFRRVDESEARWLFRLFGAVAALRAVRSPSALLGRSTQGMVRVRVFSKSVACKKPAWHLDPASSMLRLGRLVCCISSVALVALVLGGCGGGAKGNTTSGGTTSGGTTSGGTPSTGTGTSASVEPVSEPNAAVARVGGHVITRAAFAHSLAGLIKFEQLEGIAPVPPDFTACIDHLQATAAAGAKPSQATLKSQCEAQRQSLVKQALDPLISQQWVIGGAAEAGVSVSEAGLQQYLKTEERGRPQALVAKTLAKQGETLADFALRSKVQILSEGIRHIFVARTEHPTQAQVTHYYNEHKAQFGTPPRRAVEIARAATEAEALKVKREIASGQSFASVVKHLPLGQPIFSKDGLVASYEPNLYSEPPLNNAMFAAHRDVLSGPVKIFLGYYVFEVKQIFPPTRQPLAQAEATIRTVLPNELYKSAFSAYVAAWRARWKAKTICSPGFVVAKCAGAPGEPEDPFTLD
jgi:hypothetical protein